MSNIRVIEKPVAPNVVRMLEEKLVEAKAGKILGVVIVSSYDDACTSHSWAGVVQNCVRITGECFIAAHSLAQSIEEDRW